ncbi:ring finger and WD repeat domain 2 [Gorgonomyces haynaldii]|nr:ring finger and WD repeat domain 2 [Gorgonomyces haynaldii]
MQQLRQLQEQVEILDRDLSRIHDRKKLKTPFGQTIPIHPRLLPHLQDLQQDYFQEGKLDTFSTYLSEFSRYSRFTTLASLQFSDSYFNNSTSIVSAIEFDKDDEFFATGGVTKKIKIFDYNSVVSDSHFKETIPKYPIREIPCNSKISCLAYNRYIKPYLVSSDYEGIISLWDVNQGALVSQFDEHERRVWSVDFSDLDPTTVASGGDDTKVKIWSTNHKQSQLMIDTKANVCSVKFHPTLRYHLAFGSADHHVHYYDLRKPSQPLAVFKGHKKAVSYVKFVDSEHMITASTDCSLRQWSLERTRQETQHDDCVRVYKGHTNEKNFVGLSINASGTFIATGSETNQVFCYHSRLSKPVMDYPFGNSIDPISGAPVPYGDPMQFVSSVCWKRRSNVLVCANSQGRVKVLEMH